MIPRIFTNTRRDFPAMMRYVSIRENINIRNGLINRRNGIPCYATTALISAILPAKVHVDDIRKADLVIGVVFDQKTSKAVHSFCWTPLRKKLDFDGLMLDSSSDKFWPITTEIQLGRLVVPSVFGHKDPILVHLESYNVMNYDYYYDFLKFATNRANKFG